MNVIRLMGGLGNQLFQYAFGKAHKRDSVAYDISNFRKGGHRFYMLDKFNVNLTFSPFVNKSTVTDSISRPKFDMDFLSMKNKNYFGYWQYIEYFQHLLPILKEEVTVRKEFYTKEFLELREKVTDKIAVHVRRDDYLTSNTIDNLSFAYYYEAIEKTEGDLYVFSDDIPWCKSVFTEKYFNRKITFVQLPYYLDFELMKLCPKKITANSTFSWWASILGGGQVITPNIWITKYDTAVRHNFPKEWTKIYV